MPDNKKKVGRPKKNIDKNEFEKLCALQCTEQEICGWFNTTDKTLERWCRENYNARFSEVFALKRGAGKISLRRNQFKLSEKNASMAIWLGKQYLGQTDNTSASINLNTELEDDPITRALKEEMKNANK